MRGRKMHMAILVAAAVSLAVPSLYIPSLAAGGPYGYPMGSATVSVADNIKTYTYFIDNTYGGGCVYDFGLYMPKAGALSVMDITWSGGGGGWTASYSDEYPSYVEFGATIRTGETATIWLTTPADVPTGYYDHGTGHSWYYYTEHSVEWGYGVLPVPGVPESSSLLALACGLAGLVGRSRRRSVRRSPRNPSS
jgi:hypothetical protein